MIPSVAQEARRLTDVSNRFRDHAQGTSANDICGNEIIRKDNHVQLDLDTVKRAVASHCDDAVGDYEMRTHGCAYIENALVNACPVKNVLRPAVSTARHNPEHVFHAESDAGPVVRLHLWHRNDEIGGQHGSRKPQMIQAGVLRLELDLGKFVAI